MYCEFIVVDSVLLICLNFMFIVLVLVWLMFSCMLVFVGRLLVCIFDSSGLVLVSFSSCCRVVCSLDWFCLVCVCRVSENLDECFRLLMVGGIMFIILFLVIVVIVFCVVFILLVVVVFVCLF